MQECRNARSKMRDVGNFQSVIIRFIRVLKNYTKVNKVKRRDTKYIVIKSIKFLRDFFVDLRVTFYNST